SAAQQATIAQAAAEAKASVRGIQIGNRDVILSATPDALQKASAYVAERKAAALKFVDQMEKLSKSPENRERMTKLGKEIENLAKGKDLLEGVRKQAIPLEAKRAGGDNSAELTAQINKYAEEIARIRREVTVPANDESEMLAGKIVDFGKARADEA